MAYGRVLRSPYAHARIASIDTSAAEALPGVIAVMTGRNLPSSDPFYGHALKDRPVLAMERVRFVGEPVAAVAAETPAIADAALDLIEVEYAELPAATTIDQALAPGAPLLHDAPSVAGRALSRPGRDSAGRGQRLLPPRVRTRRLPMTSSPTRTSWLKVSTSSLRSSSTRWNLTPRLLPGRAMTI